MIVAVNLFQEGIGFLRGKMNISTQCHICGCLLCLISINVTPYINKLKEIVYSNVLKTGPVSEPKKGPGGLVFNRGRSGTEP